MAPFRRLWIALSLSSLGDWLGLLATTAMATTLTDTYRSHLYATGGVLAVRMAPALLFGPLAGAFADRFDRRTMMVVCDVMRCGLFVSIPAVRSLAYLLVASFAVEIFSLFWIPAKEASVPNIVPRDRLEAANQLSLVTTYGMAPVAAAVFSLLALLSRALGAGSRFFVANPNDLALWFDAGTFAFSAFTVWRIREISTRQAASAAATPGRSGAGDLLRSIMEGWRFAGSTRMVRGLVVGILGAFAAGGAVIATGRVFVADLGGGEAAYGVVFGAVFLGLALGMLVGPRVLRLLSRRRMFGLSIVGAGVALAVTAVLPDLEVAVVTTLVVGAFAGVAWVTGNTLLGGEVDDHVRGRTFALVQSLVRVDLLAVLAVAPFVAGAIGRHYVGVRDARVRFDGVTIVLLASGLFAAAVGALALRQMDDRRGVPLLADVLAALRGRRYRGEPHLGGVFIAFEGGEGAGKSTQVRQLAGWLSAQGRDVVVTHEPGGTEVGGRLRRLLLDPASTISPRAEALLYAADRAAHVETVIEPALRRGAVVVTDRYADSSIAYQGAGRALPAEEVAELSAWATGGLRPDLTVLLDVDPAVGLGRVAGPADRIESESIEFHRRVREGFRALAGQRPEAYLVVDAAQPPDRIAARVRERVAGLVPGPATGPAAAPAAGAPAAGAPAAGTPPAGATGPGDPATEILISGDR
ncbi:MAG: dTMP kinase [Frankiaceae bacterium]